MRYTVQTPNTTTSPLFACSDAMTLMDILGIKREAIQRIEAGKGQPVTIHGNGRYYLDRYTTLLVTFDERG